jgi:thiamine kinase-like enzyme
MVSASFAVRYLQSVGLLDLAATVDRGIRLIPASGRTGGLQVEVAGGPSYFLKGATTKNGRLLIRRESEVYAWLWRQFVGDRPFAPFSYGFDERNGLLILDLQSGVRTLHEAEVARKRSLVYQAGMVAVALARLHRMSWTAGASDVPKNQLQWLRRATPLEFHLYENLSDCDRGCVSIIQGQPALVQSIRELADGWSADHPIHGDLRWANVLVGRQRRGSLWLIDWEFAGLGDACWDTGCFLANYVAKWVASVPVSSDLDMESAVALASRPLGGMHGAARTFWRTYVDHMGLDEPTAQLWLERTARFLAARLLKISVEVEPGPVVSNYQVALIQLAQNVFAQPLAAMESLLALP